MSACPVNPGGRIGRQPDRALNVSHAWAPCAPHRAHGAAREGYALDAKEDGEKVIGDDGQRRV
ncbi:MAG: hypothetical protein WA950_00865 [Shinella sp.]|uniref:hypothetical protein n=1 Tax=Shinella sp. TaxID=1870904 RepID=UPI003C760DC6